MYVATKRKKVAFIENTYTKRDDITRVKPIPGIILATYARPDLSDK